MIRMLTFRTSECILKQLRQSASSSPAVTQVVTSSGFLEKEKVEEKVGLEIDKAAPPSKAKRTLVSAAFEKLKTIDGGGIEIHDSISNMISEAKDINGLLSIVSQKRLTRNHALKMVSVLADWTVEGKVQTSEFEKDPRFAVVCQVLGSEPSEGGSQGAKPRQKGSTDLVTVLGVTSDDEAAKLISNITLSQMIKVLSTLASKKRRSTTLLRSLAFNIASSSEKLDIKQGADALYAVACLNFHDEMLVDKICSDLCACLMDNSRRAVVGSIITSLGHLRYKHIDLLNLLGEWVEKHMDVCLSQDLMSVVMTMAVVHHTPSNHSIIFPRITEQLQEGLSNPLDWLDLVWALTVLGYQTQEQVASVLSSEFSDKIKVVCTDGLSVPTKLKLLNINGVAKMMLKDYKGPLLDVTLEEWKAPLLRSKEKQALVTCVQETMLNLLPSAIYLNTNIDTEMGFMIDAECLMNAKLSPLPLFDKKTKTPIVRSGPDTQRGIKVALMVLDFHDMTRGRRELTGVNKLSQELLHLKGYRIMTVDYVDFNPQSKLVNRVQYLNQKLKAAIGKS